MKRFVVLLSCLIFTSNIFSQLTVSKVEGGSVVTKLSMGIKVNQGSSLKRDWVTINDPACPIQLNDIGIETSYGSSTSSSYSFKSVGSFVTKEPIVAYEVVHVLYNVFGEHMKSLSNQEVTDIDVKSDFSKYASWYASENDVSEFLICVTYVSNVRTKSGLLWHYSYKPIKEQLDKLKIYFEEGYAPKKDKEKDK